MEKLLKKDIELLKRFYGNHSIVAREIGIGPRYYRMIRSGEKRPGKFLMWRFNQVIEHAISSRNNETS